MYGVQIYLGLGKKCLMEVSLIANMLVDIYVLYNVVNMSCQRSLLVLCFIKIRQLNGKATIIIVTIAHDNSVTIWAASWENQQSA